MSILTSGRDSREVYINKEKSETQVPVLTVSVSIHRAQYHLNIYLKPLLIN